MATDDVKKYAEYGLSRLSDFVTSANGTWGTKVKTESPSFMNTPKDYDTSITVDEQQAYTPSLNWAKVWRLKFGLGAWDNWRASSINHIASIHSNVFLISEKSEIAMDTGIELESVSLDKMTDFGPVEAVKKAVKGVASLASTASGFLGNGLDGIMTSTYGGLKGMKGLKPLTVPGSMTFTFYFGQAGLYDAAKEVVLPVLALVGCTAAHNPKYSHMFKGQVPSCDYLMGQLLRSVVDNGMAALSSLVTSLTDVKTANGDSGSGSSSGSGSGDITKAKEAATGAAQMLIKAAIGVNDSIYKAIDGSYLAVISSDSNKMAYFKLGIMEIGPCYIETTSFTFDYSATDSNGMPTKGTVTFGGITTPLLSTASNIRGMLNSSFTKSSMRALGTGSDDHLVEAQKAFELQHNHPK